MFVCIENHCVTNCVEIWQVYVFFLLEKKVNRLADGEHRIFCTNNKLKLIAYERKWHNKKM